MSSISPLTLDPRAKNFLLRNQDQAVFKDGEETQIEHPSSRKITEQAIFESRDRPEPLRHWIGRKSGPVLYDFGEACTGKDSYTEHIQPAVYRASEVFLHLSWGTSVDIWNLSSMVGLLISVSSCSPSHPSIVMEP